MKLSEFYKLAVKAGIAADPRPKSRIHKALKQAQKEYKELRGAEKTAYDKEKLVNPYADTRILHGDRERQIKSIMVGIDMGGPELLLCDRLIQRGREIDLVMSHHPNGAAMVRLSQVMNMQSDILNKLGLSLEVAQDLMKVRIKETERAFSSRNFSRDVDIAKLLDIPYICCHTVADNFVSSFLQRIMDKNKPKKLKDVINLLNKVPEYREANASDAGPRIISGKPDNVAGKVFIDMTGGTEGSKGVFGRLSQLGIKTIVAMHLSEAHIKAAKKEYINLIIAGHIASDNVGLNLLLDKLCKVEELEIIECSGFRRVER